MASYTYDKQEQRGSSKIDLDRRVALSVLLYLSNTFIKIIPAISLIKLFLSRYMSPSVSYPLPTKNGGVLRRVVPRNQRMLGVKLDLMPIFVGMRSTRPISMRDRAVHRSLV